MDPMILNNDEINKIIERERRVTRIITFSILGIIGFLFLKNKLIFKPYESIDDFNDIPAPIQTDTTGRIEKTIDGIDYQIEYIAEYSISGLAVDVQKYFDFEYGKLSPVDVGISWGFLVGENHRLHWYSKGTRFLHYETRDVDWYYQVGHNKINEHFSNNHLIPSNPKIEKAIKNIKKGDFIKIEGYLVRTTWIDLRGYAYRWNSSTSRKDEGNGACEIIYVTDVKWLKEKR